MTKRQLYPHQLKVAQLVLAGKNVLLQAPTGAGKTLAALMPFLNAVQNGSPFPSRCIYSVPMRVLANQFTEEYRKEIGDSSYADDITVAIQTGENQGARELDANLIFATIDQTLSNFLLSPYSLSKRKANINAGAVVSSYLVFDEFHLFDPESTLPTTLHMLKMLDGIVPFVLMTATFSETMLGKLAAELNAVIVPQNEVARHAMNALPSQNKTRRYHTVDTVMQAETILDKNTGRTLVICNIVDRARKLFEAIRERTDKQVLLLHSRLLPKDRNQVEDDIRQLFSKDAKDTDTIVISTQAIEVGVDMSATVLHTELAPANAIIQRAGRCARYQDNEGDVYIYSRAIHKDEEIDLREKTLPYSNPHDESQKTWDSFRQYEGQHLTFTDEQTILSAVHGASDEEIIEGLRINDKSHRDDVYATMRGDAGTDARHLIRDIQQQPVTIHDNPEKLLNDPFAYSAFGLHPGTVQGYITAWLDSPDYLNQDDICMLCEYDNEDDVQFNETRYYWKPVTSPEQARYAKLLVVHPRLATYDPTLGFLADRGGAWIAETPDDKTHDEDKKQSLKGKGYRKETYERHIELVYESFLAYWQEAKFAARQIEKCAEWEVGSITKAAHLAVLMHDVGKLSIGWQKWAHAYQSAYSEIMEDTKFAPQADEAYAHTDYIFGNEHCQLAEQQVKAKRPWHAVEGGIATFPFVDAVLNNKALMRAVMSAIARHHAPYSDSYQTFQLIPDADRHIRATLPESLQDIDINLLGHTKLQQKNSITHNVISPEGNQFAYLAYLLIVRALRRADVTGTKYGAI